MTSTREPTGAMQYAGPSSRHAGPTSQAIAVGTSHRLPVLEVDDGDWHRMMDVNLTSAFRLGTGQVLYVDGGRTLV
ncbi:hypothetical protein [Arthrobacter pigmenti]